jgi:two-component system, NarL family, response regulator NreC
MRRKTRVLIIDDENLVRDGVQSILELEEELEILGARSDFDASEFAAKTSPHVVILEFALRGHNGSEVLAGLKLRWPEVRVLILTCRHEDDFFEAALRAGADGYLLKSDSREELMSAIRVVADKKRYISPSLFDRAVKGYLGTHPSAHHGAADGLSARERQVMKKIALGLRTREIAVQLSLSHKTIEKHRSSLMRKLGLRSATAVAAYATAHGYLDVC